MCTQIILWLDGGGFLTLSFLPEINGNRINSKSSIYLEHAVCPFNYAFEPTLSRIHYLQNSLHFLNVRIIVVEAKSSETIAIIKGEDNAD